MKTLNVILIAGVVGVIAYKDKLLPMIGKGINKIGESIKSDILKKIEIKPYKMPTIKFDILSSSANLKGQLKVTNKTPLSVTINSYQIDLILRHSSKQLIIGSTPINTIDSQIKASGSSLLSYIFNVNIDGLKTLYKDFKNLNGCKVFAVVKNIKINGLSLPDTEIETGLWQEVEKTLKTVNDPSILISDFIKNL